MNIGTKVELIVPPLRAKEFVFERTGQLLSDRQAEMLAERLTAYAVTAGLQREERLKPPFVIGATKTMHSLLRQVLSLWDRESLTPKFALRAIPDTDWCGLVRPVEHPPSYQLLLLRQAMIERPLGLGTDDVLKQILDTAPPRERMQVDVEVLRKQAGAGVKTQARKFMRLMSSEQYNALDVEEPFLPADWHEDVPSRGLIRQAELLHACSLLRGQRVYLQESTFGDMHRLDMWSYWVRVVHLWP